MSSREHGSLDGWRTCMAEGWRAEKTASQYRMHTLCNTKISAYQDGTLQITNLESDDGQHCPGKAAENIRRFSGRVNNPTANVYLTSFGWSAQYPQKRVPAQGRGHMLDRMLAPGESEVVCLFTLEFDNAASANRLEAYPHLLAVNVSFERGVVDRQ